MRKSNIESDRIKIVPFSEKYLTLDYINWLNDSDVMQFSDQKNIIHTLETSRKYYESFNNSENNFWAILLKSKDDLHIGNLTTYVDSIHSVVDISILIGDKTKWGNGFGLEAWQLMCNYMLLIKKFRKVTGGTLSVNTPMLSIMRRVGMVEDGRRIRHCLYKGEEVDIIHAALFRENIID